MRTCSRSPVRSSRARRSGGESRSNGVWASSSRAAWTRLEQQVQPAWGGQGGGVAPRDFARADVVVAEVEAGLWLDALDGSALHRIEGGAEGLVPVDQRLETALQHGAVEVAGEAHRGHDVVGRAGGGLELDHEPEPLLVERQRDLAGAGTGCGSRGSSAVSPSRRSASRAGFWLASRSRSSAVSAPGGACTRRLSPSTRTEIRASAARRAAQSVPAPQRTDSP
jgi:hypothetical protein